jgi:TonB family protein
MLFKKDEELELQPRRTKTLLISIGIHVLLLVLLALNPELLTSTPKRIIKVMSQDYDLSKQQLTELIAPPDALRSKPPTPPPENKPLVQPPAPRPENRPPQQQPPPPPPPPKPQPPPPVIGPDDVIKEGARPDAQPKPSRGDTREQARAGSQPEPSTPEPPKQQQPQPPQSENKPPQIARNTNPDALRSPTLMDDAERIMKEDIEGRRRTSVQGPRTGLPNVQSDPNFSTEEPTILSDTKGYDFGPYMNQVVNRVRYNWYANIPEIARFGKKGKVVIIFTITHNGNIDNARIVANSGTEPLDRAAFASITLSNPFPRLPAGFDGDHLDLQFTFLYNIR